MCCLTDIKISWINPWWVRLCDRSDIVIFAILHYIENKVTLGHNKTCTSKMKNGTYVYRKSKKKKKKKKNHRPTKKGNVLFAKPHPKDGYANLYMLLKKKMLFCQKDWKEVVKATKGAASVLQFIRTTFSSTSVTTPMTPHHPTVWDSIKFKFTCK